MTIIIILPKKLLTNGHLAAASSSVIQIWNMSSYSVYKTLIGHSNSIYALAELPNNLLASGSNDFTLKIWNLTNGTLLSSTNPYSTNVLVIKVQNDSKLNVGGLNRNLTIWNVSSNGSISKTSFIGIKEVSGIFASSFDNNSNIFYATDKGYIIKMSIKNNSNYTAYPIYQPTVTAYGIEYSSK